MNRTIIAASIAATTAVAAVGVYFWNKRSKTQDKPSEVQPTKQDENSITSSPVINTEQQQEIENAFFDSVFAACDSIEFLPEYHNGTGYFDGLCTVPLARNEKVRTVDELGRKMIAIGSGPDNQGKHNNAVVFERYVDRSKLIVQVGSYNRTVTPAQLVDIFAVSDKYETVREFLNLS